MERIDKIISSQGSYSRSDVKKLIQQKRVKIDGKVVLKSDIKIDKYLSEIKIDDNPITIKDNIYLILNKPEGYVSATKDNKDKTVLELVPQEYQKRELFPAGRLDKNTTGLMIITDDGKFAHNILAPKKTRIQKIRGNNRHSSNKRNEKRLRRRNRTNRRKM